jgi:hypothetical protein
VPGGRPWIDHEPAAPRTPRPGPRRTTRRYRVLRTLLILAAVLIVLGFVLDRALDRPLQGFVVRTLNDNLV